MPSAKELDHMRRIILPNDIDVVVASFGGVGTSFLLSHLASYKKTNHPSDRDGFKHSPLPPISLNRKVKFVYVYGDPKAAAISIFRRNFQYSHSKKLQKWRSRPVDPIPKGMTLREYVLNGIDRFHFERHFYNWYQTYVTHPTIFVRYETMFDNIEPLLEFLEIPREYVVSFPRKRPRSSTQNELPVEVAEGLQKMYGDFSEKLSTLDDVAIRIPSYNLPYVNYLKHPYLRALSRRMVESSEMYLKVQSPGVYRVKRRLRRLVSAHMKRF